MTEKKPGTRTRTRIYTSYIKRYFIQAFGILLIVVGGYLLLVTYSPKILQRPEIITVNLPAVGEVTSDYRYQVIVPKINVSIPYKSGDADVLNNGAWWRFPEHGNPKDGGNFILSAHRFRTDLTPSGTLTKSPFYDINKLELGDRIVIIHDRIRYDYKIVEKLTVHPDATSIENPSDEAKLTLYSCTLGGSYDGREVIIAKPSR